MTPVGDPIGWRSLVARPAEQERPASVTALALGIELRRLSREDARAWRRVPPAPAHPRDIVRDPGVLSLAVRPLMRSAASGQWIKGEASWDALRRPQPRFAERQQRWFSDLLSISRESLLSGTAGEWLVLDHVASPLLWPHLARMSDAGVPLVAVQKHTDAVLAQTATAHVRLGRGRGDALVLNAAVSIDGAAADGALVRPIGRHGLYAVQVRGARLDVRLAPAPLDEAVLRLLDGSGAVEVPRAEEAEFFREAYPSLARSGALEVDEVVSVPAAPAPVAVLDVRFAPRDLLTYRWWWSYDGYGEFGWDTSAEPFRDLAEEGEIAAEAGRIWSELAGGRLLPEGELTGIEAAEVAGAVLPALEAAGVRVRLTGRRKDYRELEGRPEISVRTVETTDPDWFDLGVIVTIEGRTIPFEQLFTALSTGRRKLLLADGGYFSLAHPALDRLRELIGEAAELAEWETGPRLNRRQLALWEEFEDLADVSEPALAWRRLADGLREGAEVAETPVPAGIAAQLRPYQRRGLDWLAFLWRHRLGGVLADDMGLGKTLQVLALIQHAVEQGETRPFLVVAPTSVLGTWRAEAARFAPELRTAVIEGTSRRRGVSLADAISGVQLVITSYAIARLDEEDFAARPWAAVVLDEAQFVKNPATRLHRAVASFRADAVFAITGTPLENTLADLWALLKLTAPGLFPSARVFRQDYIQPIEQGKVPENAEGAPYRAARLARLRRRIRPLVLRRTKDLVAAELPAKQEQVLPVELGPTHRARYDTVLQRERQKLLGLLDDLDRNRFIVFRSLTMLRLLSLDPALLDPADAGIGSTKLDVLVERIAQLHAEGHRALVFSQFTSFLRRAEERLTEAGIRSSYLDGSTRRRQEVVDGFRAGDDPVFLISLKAGGFGLTLTEADYVFLLDPWWNPAAEAQAIDRTHRIGQLSQVFVYRLIAAGTIEEKVLALQQRKARLFQAVVDDEDLFAQSLTADDIRGLLETDRTAGGLTIRAGARG